jgi:hypothetical protein
MRTGAILWFKRKEHGPHAVESIFLVWNLCGWTTFRFDSKILKFSHIRHEEGKIVIHFINAGRPSSHMTKFQLIIEVKNYYY